MRKRNWLLQKNENPEPDDLFIEKMLRRDALLNLSQCIVADDPLTCGADFLPVGDIAFVGQWLQTYHKKPMLPIEVPTVLRTEEYLGRSYTIIDRDKLPSYENSSRKYFVKNISQLKAFNSALYEGTIPNPSTLPPGKYLLSGWLDIRAEFRIFVFHDEVLGIQPYLGSPLAFPNPEKVLRMVNDYKQDHGRPEAYTMDVAVICKKDQTADTVILEIHPFVSCGLYGFYDMDVPNMLEAGLQYYIKHQEE